MLLKWLHKWLYSNTIQLYLAIFFLLQSVIVLLSRRQKANYNRLERQANIHRKPDGPSHIFCLTCFLRSTYATVDTISSHSVRQVPSYTLQVIDLAFDLEGQQSLHNLNGKNASLYTSPVEIYMMGIVQDERKVDQRHVESKSTRRYRKPLIRLCRPVPFGIVVYIVTQAWIIIVLALYVYTSRAWKERDGRREER